MEEKVMKKIYLFAFLLTFVFYGCDPCCLRKTEDSSGVLPSYIKAPVDVPKSITIPNKVVTSPKAEPITPKVIKSMKEITLPEQTPQPKELPQDLFLHPSKIDVKPDIPTPSIFTPQIPKDLIIADKKLNDPYLTNFPFIRPTTHIANAQNNISNTITSIEFLYKWRVIVIYIFILVAIPVIATLLVFLSYKKQLKKK